MKYVVQSKGVHTEYFGAEFFKSIEEAVARCAVKNKAMKPEYADFAVYEMVEVKQ